MRLHHWIAITIAISTFLVGYCVLSPSVLPKLWQMQRREDALEAETAALQKQIRGLGSEAVLLSGGSPESRETIEEIARKEHGLVGRDEMLLMLGPEKGTPAHHEKNIHP